MLWGVESDIELAFRMVDAADAQSARWWNPDGTRARFKDDGTPVTDADIAAETAMLTLLRDARPDDGLLGEEVGEHVGSSGRRWIADGIDGTDYFARGDVTWGTLLALEVGGEIVLGVCSSPVQNRRWWAERGAGAFTGSCDRSGTSRLRVSRRREVHPDLLVCLPSYEALGPGRQQVLEHLAGGAPLARPWSQQNRVAEGEVDLCVWFAGDIWDHAAPSIIVEEAGGRFTDHKGGKRLDTRTAVYSNGLRHEEALAALEVLSGIHER